MSRPRSAALLVSALVTPLLGLAVAQGEAVAAPNFQVPFPCNQVWEGQTRTNHRPANSVDFNRANDEGDPVVASAAGTVSRVANEGSTSYGRWIEIDHGGGWKTRYAHLSAQRVSVGQAVALGQRIGDVGNTGGSTGAHLHYEQLLDGADQKVKFNGTTAYYWGTRSYTSRNSCSGTGFTGTVGTDSGTGVTIRSGPGTQYAAVGAVADGETVTISCQAEGESITGKYGTTVLWDKIGPGYISDAYVYTGSDGQVAPDC
ncbi:M23 family metallopeptidase [Saccharothrix coeruleofusca]|uniref:Peptidase M23 n=1 Tax=Saccharothrix coeruleofusca TaxID=33919 RepID=A0A918ED13_9PSEU|nr:M23 family metallopeptidase [Saccharothrix coeruleofusca]GGP40668.1 peptidase M23 [Saccharothrix coeruleofusca]